MACLNTETKESLLSQIDELLPESSRKVKLADFINSLDACSTEDTQLGKKKKRPLSKYNIYLSKCMKGTETGIKQPMKFCIEGWRELKNKKS